MKATVKRQVVGMLLQIVRMGRPQFTGLMLERVDPRHPLSGLRRLRELKAAGLVDYKVTNAAKSRYEVTSTEIQLTTALRSL